MHGVFRTSFQTTHEWVSWLNGQLPKPRLGADAPVVLDLFAGCGGLALGFEAAGFRTIGYEMATAPVLTYNANLGGQCHRQRIDVGDELETAEIVIGGPPCQPFSQIGYQRGRHDDRDGFPTFLDVVRRMQPKIAIVENVRGLMFRSKDYLKLVVKELESFGYAVDTRLLNTADYGVPQKRERIVIVASRIGWEWPEPITKTPVSVGVALGEMAKEHSRLSRFLTPSMDAYIATYEAKSACVQPRDLHLHKPSRTLTCRNLAGATSDMLRLKLPDGRRRMLHVQEAARLQSFPDWFEFQGTEAEQLEQIGNSVAPLMSLAIAKSVMKALKAEASSSPLKSATTKSIEVQTELFVSDAALNEKVEQSTNILRQIGMPLRDFTARRRSRVAKALLAVANIRPNDAWNIAASMADGFKPLKTRSIISFWNQHYGENVADSSYDDVRRKDLIWLVDFGLVDRSAADPNADVNDGTRGYALSPEAVILLRSYGTAQWEANLAVFRSQHATIADRLSRARDMKMVPITIPSGKQLKLTPGPHNELQRDIIDQLLPRFAPGAELLYLGDTANKNLHCETERLTALGLPTPGRGTLPDIIVFDESKGWVFFIEAVSSFGPISAQRRESLRTLAKTHGKNHKIIFITAVPDRKTFAKFSQEIGWETEVWIASDPSHMIHFDGEKYLSPYEGDL
jgi:DNA (cytosine-5)-methyltransferase 1